jgi:3-oxoacyl-[acyl-carrier protein] reductase
MVLKGKNAIVYGAAGSMGGAVARAFGREGANVFLVGRTLTKLDKVAEDIRATGSAAETAEVDALDQTAVNSHADQVAKAAGSIDISFNAINFEPVQNMPLVNMSVKDFMNPIERATKSYFVTTTAAARHMTAQGSGVIIMLSSSAALEYRHQMGGFNLACACVEALTRSLAGEVGRTGVRVVGLRPNFTPETDPRVTEEDLPQLVNDTILGRLPRLREVADTAVFLASDAAGAMSGTVVNLSCGAVHG